VLSRLFRRRFLEELRAAYRGGALQFFGEYAELADAAAFAKWLAPLGSSEWVVYAKRPFAGPAAVLAYLSRYTHRVAISNSRKEHLALARELLHVASAATSDPALADPVRPTFVCAHCGAPMVIVQTLVRERAIRAPPQDRGVP